MSVFDLYGKTALRKTSETYYGNTMILSAQWARKFKKVQAEKTREIKYMNFTKFIFDQNPFFAISNLTKNQFLNWGKSLKLPKMQFHEEKLHLFNFTISALPGLF